MTPLLNLAAVTWLKYCRYGVKLYPINQSINKLWPVNDNMLEGYNSVSDFLL